MSSSIFSILQKCKNEDPDLRSMAMIDLQQELQRDNFTLDSSHQVQLTEMILNLLEDETSRVRGAASECLKYFVKKLNQPLLDKTCLDLANYIIRGEEEKREFATNALKTVILKMPTSNASTAVSNVTEPLLLSLRTNKLEVQLDSLDILNDVALRFGKHFLRYQPKVQEACLELLSSDQRALKKRCVSLLATISVTSSVELFTSLMDVVRQKLKSPSTLNGEVHTSVQLTCAIAKKAGHRLGKYLNEIVTILMNAIEEIADDDQLDEVRENILEALELFVLKCPSEIAPHIDLIVIICKEYLEYDPNYSYDTTDEDEMEDEEDEEEEEDEDMDDGEYSDDDDISWKVRSAAAKCLNSIIKTRPDKLKHFYTELLADEDFDLTSRFKEREDSVKLLIFNIFKSLLANTLYTTTTPEGKQEVQPKSEATFVERRKSQILLRLRKQLSSKNSKVKVGVFQVFNSIVRVLQGKLKDQVTALFKATKNVLIHSTEQDVQLKIEALSFLRSLLKYESFESFGGIYEDFANTVLRCTEDKFFKITADALRTAEILIDILSANRNASYFQAQVSLLYQKVYNKLQLQDIDQEVKVASISTMGTLLSVLKDDIGSEAEKSLELFLEKMRSETTRITSIRALNQIASNQFNISSILHEAISELHLFLRKSNRILRQHSLVCLKSIIIGYKDQITEEEVKNIIGELAPLVSDQDLNLAHLALDLSLELLKSTSCPKYMEATIVPKAMSLLKSNTLQGNALTSLIEFMQEMSKYTPYSTLLNAILSTVTDSIGKQAYGNIGRVVSGLVEVASASDRESTIEQFILNLQSSKLSDRILAFFTIGEIGSRRDLTSYGKLEEHIQNCFKSEVEEVKYAASYCLGNVAIGNLNKFLPSILQKIQTNESETYLLIHALKQIIIQADGTTLSAFIKDITPILFNNANNNEESIRSVVAECLGKIAVVDYDSVLSGVKQMLTGDDLLKITAIGALKFAVTERGVNSEKLRKDIPEFLSLLNKNQSVSVRKSCILLLTSTIRNNASLIADNLDQLLPSLYQECVFDKTLITVIDLGPFKHKVDGGIELRKSAFECLRFLLTNLSDRIDPKAFVPQLVQGVTDVDNDINLLTFHIIVECTEKFPRALLTILDQITEPMEKILKKKLGEKVQAQQVEIHEELQRATIRAYCAIEAIGGLEDYQSFQMIKLQIIDKNPKLSTMYQVISNERNILTFE